MNSGPGRGRYAPSPTGPLHLGNVRTALVAWLSARASGGSFILRVEDLDAARTANGMEERVMEDLHWLGLDWDEGPDVGGNFGPYRQSDRSALYEEALRTLAAAGRTFPCRLSRKDLQSLATAPHSEGGAPYPASLRPSDLLPDWYDRVLAERDAAVRFKVDESPVEFTDIIAGPQTENVVDSVGDFVLRRRDDVYAYQLAVVVDDIQMHVTEVVRGRDLLSSTARQIQLIRALGGSIPRYAHVPLVRNSNGEKLSKRDAGLTLASIREQGATPAGVVGYLAWSLGLIPVAEPVSAADLVDVFAWSRISRDDWIVADSHQSSMFSGE